MDVESESIVDAVLVSIPAREDGAGDGDLLLRRLLMEGSSSTVAGFGFIFVGVLGLDLCVDDIVEPARPCLLRHGLLCPEDDLVLIAVFTLTSLPSLRSSLISSTVAFKVGRFSSTFAAGSIAVKGGLGGPFTAASFVVASTTFSSSPVFLFWRSVGSGVKMFGLAMPIFSLLPTSSRLWAFEKEGYGRLTLLPLGEIEDARRCSSGIGIDALLLVDESARVELLSNLAELFSSLEELFRFVRVDLCLLFSRRSVLP